MWVLWRRQRLIRADAQSVDVRAFDLAQSAADLAHSDRSPFANRFEHPQSRTRATSESGRLLIPTAARDLVFRRLQFHSRTKSRGGCFVSMPIPWSICPDVASQPDQRKMRKRKCPRLGAFEIKGLGFDLQAGPISLPRSPWTELLSNRAPQLIDFSSSTPGCQSTYVRGTGHKVLG